MKFTILVVIFGNILTAFTLNCGYKGCPKVSPNLLNVHIVTHTHDDVGWLKTVDQYYYGSQTMIQKAGVQYIIDSVVQELLKDPEKRFIYVESAFFFKWWREQSSELQDKVKMLVNEGRLEFIGGAWSMNDEATTHYQSIIDQFAWGLRRLNDTFGECGRPRIGWQIDPFGHSREMASIFAQMGYDGLFFGRLDYQDKEERMMSKTAEMIWRASANLGEKSHLFTGVLYNQYQPPPGFCFDVLCADEPIIDDPNSPDNNVAKRVSQFLDFINKQRKYYRTNNIILTMGGDFTYMDANVYYKNLDKLIRYANDRQQNGSDANLFYSTPSCYLKSLYDSQIKWPTKNDDFFPYGSDSHSYWTGYYTSRPTLKRFERVGNNFLQICKQLTALSPKRDISSLAHLTAMREVMGVMQHHDAVTGTEKQKVALDYEKQLAEGIRGCEVNAKVALNYLQGTQMDLKSCHLLNISICHISEQNEHFRVTVYNPLGQFTDDYIRLPVKKGIYLVDDSDEILETEMIPIPEPVLHLHFRKPWIRFELVFPARNIPPLGYKSFYVSKSKEESKRIVPMEEPVLKNPDFTIIGNEHIQITFDANGFLAAVTANGVSRLISQEFLYYDAASGSNRNPESRSSGAYIFRPRNNTYHSVTQWPTIKVYKNALVEEVHQKFNSWISQVIRVYRDEKFAEFEWLIGPIPAADNSGKEIITRFNTNIKSDGVFYTDSNGREMIKRKRDYRSTWKVKLEETVAGNYYPITSKIAIEDDEARLAILVDRAQGGTSLFDGSLEIMIHRRLLHDDAFGVDEPLNEVECHKGLIARGIHYLILGPSQRDSSPTIHAIERFVQQKKHLAPWKFVSADKSYLSNLHHNSVFSGLKNSLPRNIHLLTFEPWHKNEILIRLEHIFEQNEDPEFSKSVQINLTEIFSQFLVIEKIRETTLDGSQWLEDLHRLKFKSEKPNDSYNLHATDPSKMDVNKEESIEIVKLPEEPKADNMKWHKIPIGHKVDKKSIVNLGPMQIRTFVLTLKK